MNWNLQISAGDLELIRPIVLIVSALLSTLVFASSRKHFSFLVALLWALASFFLTLIAIPLYLLALLIRRGIPPKQVAWKRVVPLTYGVLLVAGTSIYLYTQDQGVDVHLARAEKAKLHGNRGKAIAEYRAALAEEDNPHTRKLLGVELFEADYWTQALAELRRAEQDGEQDDSVILRIGSLLDAMGLPNQAKLEYQRFLESPMCLRPVLDRRCETAKSLLARKVQ